MILIIDIAELMPITSCYFSFLFSFIGIMNYKLIYDIVLLQVTGFAKIYNAIIIIIRKPFYLFTNYIILKLYCLINFKQNFVDLSILFNY